MISLPTVTIERLYRADSTVGTLTARDGDRILILATLELPWKGNEKRISCIPEGEYQVVPRYSAKYKSHYHVQDVPNRDYILFHTGNYVSDIQGCILVGMFHKDINGDKIPDVVMSRKAMSLLVSFIGNNPFLLKIFEKYVD